MFDFSKKVEVTNDLCAAIACIAYPSIIHLNRDKQEAGGLILPGHMLVKVKTNPNGRAEYFINQEIVDEIRANIVEVAKELFAAYDNWSKEQSPNLDFDLLSKAIDNLNIAAETRWTADNCKFGVDRIKPGIIDPTSATANKNTKTNIAKTPESESRPPMGIDDDFVFDDPTEPRVSSQAVLSPKSPKAQTITAVDPIVELQNRLPSNVAAKSVIERFSKLVELGYQLEVAKRSDHVLVTYFSGDDTRKFIGQVFIDPESGIITREY